MSVYNYLEIIYYMHILVVTMTVTMAVMMAKKRPQLWLETMEIAECDISEVTRSSTCTLRGRAGQGTNHMVWSGYSTLLYGYTSQVPGAIHR